ncbi:hypothetical protein EVAR_91023_1 [Eumeta japonica]|uniref:Uncharacterized protein n=1 Tax=Eumeta variegata TaxID=151549 RepID=A0A4C1SN97_EUMVA|nr:hypothetical protein EVAR_91023_1 [Eumeta japonica]
MSNRDRVVCANSSARLGALATDATGELYVLRHDGDAFGVYRAQIRIFEETDQVRLASLLEGHHGGALEPQRRISRGDSSRPVAVGFFTPPVAGALLRAAFVASCLRGALPPVDLRAVCFVRAMTDYLLTIRYTQHTQISHTNPRLLLTRRCGVEVTKACDTIGYRDCMV